MKVLKIEAKICQVWSCDQEARTLLKLDEIMSSYRRKTELAGHLSSAIKMHKKF
jgi:hypothetical protein